MARSAAALVTIIAFKREAQGRVSARAIAVAAWILAASAPADADSSGATQWRRLSGDSHGVEVDTRSIPGSAYPQVRASGTVCATLPQLVAFVEDAARFESWIPDTEAARLLARPTPRSQIYYIRTSMPWPVKHRDMIYRLTEAPNASTPNEVSVLMDGLPEYLPENDGVVRMRSAAGRWDFRESGGRTRITLVIHIEPGGKIPGWIANGRIVGTPRMMLLKLERTFEPSCRTPEAQAVPSADVPRAK